MTIKFAPIMEDARVWKFDIAKVEEKYSASYVGEFPGKVGSGWSESSPIAVFYVADPQPPHTNNYFGLFVDLMTGNTMICNAQHVDRKPFQAVEFDNGIMYSRFRHDYIEHRGRMIDGGWDYCRTDGVTATYQLEDGVLVKVDSVTAD